MVLCPRSADAALALGHGTPANPMGRPRRGPAAHPLRRRRRRCRPRGPAGLCRLPGAGAGRQRARGRRRGRGQDEDTTEDEDTTRGRKTPRRTEADTEGAQGEHGALVSAVAQNELCVGGLHMNHGWAVSQVARGLSPYDATGCPELGRSGPGAVTDEATSTDEADVTRCSRQVRRASPGQGQQGQEGEARSTLATIHPEPRRARIEPGPFDSPSMGACHPSSPAPFP